MSRPDLRPWATAWSNAMVLVPYHAVDSGLVFLYTILTARGLGADAFGMFVTAAATGAIFFLLLDFGCTLSIARDAAAERPIADALHGSIWFRLGLVGIGLGLMPLLGAFDMAGPWLMLIALSEGLRSAQVLCQSALLGQNRVRAVALVNATEKVGVLTLLALAFWSRQGLDLAAVAASYGLGRLLAAATAIMLSRPAWSGGRPWPRAALAYTWASRRVGMFVLSERSLAYAVPLLITVTVGVAATAQFQAAYKVALLPISFFTALASAIYPVVSGMHGQPSRSLASGISRALAATLAFAIGWCLLFLLAPGELMNIIFGPGFAPAARILVVLTPSILLAAAWQVSLHILTALKAEKTVLQASLLSSIVSAAAVLALGPRLGMHAAPLALAMGLSASAARYLPALLRRELLDPSRLRLLRIASAGLLAGLLGGALLGQAPSTHWIRLALASAAAAMLYPLLLLAFRAFRIGEDADGAPRHGAVASPE